MPHTAKLRLRFRLQLDSALQRLQGLTRRLADPGSLLAPAVPVLARALERTFEAEGRPQRWAPLAPSTLRRKPPGLKILQRTGRLRRSLNLAIEGRSIVASTSVPYAPAHQFGVPSRRLPARPFLLWTQEDLEAAAQAIAASLASTV